MSRRVAITGIGVISSLGVGVDEFGRALRAGRCGIAPIERFDTSARSSHCAALVRGFRPEDHLSANRLRRMDSLSAQALAAAQLAVRDAGLEAELEAGPSPQTGVTFGTAYGCVRTTLRYASKLVQQGAYFTNPIDFPDSIDGAAAAHIAMALGLQGPSITMVDGALSGESALWHAAAGIAAGRAERMLVGAGDELAAALHAALDGLGLLCRPDQQGEERMLPYDVRRRGPVAGEGTAVLVLEAEGVARARGARIYAVLLGFGHGSDPACVPHRYGRDAAVPLASMRRALAASGVGPAEVDVFSGAAASIPALDGVELAAANELCGEAPDCRLMAVKAALGEQDSAGVLRVAAAALTLHDGVIPPLLGLITPEPATSLRIPALAETAAPRYVLHHGMARGGQSLSLVLGRA